MNLSSAPTNTTPDQLRACGTCDYRNVFPFSPSTALTCPQCKGEMRTVTLSAADIVAERKRCAEALERMATGCEEAGAANGGKVDADRAASKMRELAQWMRAG